HPHVLRHRAPVGLLVHLVGDADSLLADDADVGRRRNHVVVRMEVKAVVPRKRADGRVPSILGHRLTYDDVPSGDPQRFAERSICLRRRNVDEIAPTEHHLATRAPQGHLKTAALNEYAAWY